MEYVNGVRSSSLSQSNEADSMARNPFSVAVKAAGTPNPPSNLPYTTGMVESFGKVSFEYFQYAIGRNLIHKRKVASLDFFIKRVYFIATGYLGSSCRHELQASHKVVVGKGGADGRCSDAVGMHLAQRQGEYDDPMQGYHPLLLRICDNMGVYQLNNNRVKCKNLKRWQTGCTRLRANKNRFTERHARDAKDVTT